MLKVLFICDPRSRASLWQDPAIRYRCWQPAQALRSLGCRADVATLNEVPVNLLSNYDVCIFHRPRFVAAVRRLIGYAIRHNLTCLADYDDLIFDPVHAEYSPLLLNGRASPVHIERMYRDNLRTLQMFPVVTVSTGPLGEMVKSSHSSAAVAVIRNGLSRPWIDEEPQGVPPPFTIGYFPGTHSHDADFAEVHEALKTFMLRHAQVRLLIAGPLRCSLAGFPMERVETMSAVHYHRFPAVLRRASVNLAPLQQTTFNACKSGIKFMEAAAVSVPTVASSIEDMARFNHPGLVLCNEPNDWNEALETMTERNVLSRASAGLRDYVLSEAGVDQQARTLYRFICSLL